MFFFVSNLCLFPVFSDRQRSVAVSVVSSIFFFVPVFPRRFCRMVKIPLGVGALNRNVYPAMMEAAMGEPLNAAELSPAIASIRELIGVRPNPRL